MVGKGDGQTTLAHTAPLHSCTARQISSPHAKSRKSGTNLPRSWGGRSALEGGLGPLAFDVLAGLLAPPYHCCTSVAEKGRGRLTPRASKALPMKLEGPVEPVGLPLHPKE